ncbi:thiosulfate sulfurtransferase GlpE [Kushneria aurantia]|uniref:Thiosulfate sulfurtransferase GlpE n=1 Tax=Kushneria aurantia TaxID=504092 RepID=A0ABV6G4W0_9GAMM|nr:thiosulfate sulfurtransferase GlpE [Kushneria aurantia]
MSFKHLDHATLERWLGEGGVEIVDIRDPLSFSSGHIPGSRHLDNASLGQFIDATPSERPVVVVCYHGHSSQQAADWLCGQGYQEVYSLDGGFTHWQYHHPERFERDDGAGAS